MEQLHINCTNCTMTAGQPNAFGGTFIFFPTHRPTLKKSKRATKQPHQDTATMDGQSTIEFYWRFSSTAQIMGGK